MTWLNLKAATVVLLLSASVFVVVLKSQQSGQYTPPPKSVTRELELARGQLLTLDRALVQMVQSPSGCTPCKINSLLQDITQVSSRLRRLQSSLKQGPGAKSTAIKTVTRSKLNENPETVVTGVDKSKGVE